MEPEFYISSKFSNDVHAAGPRTRLISKALTQRSANCGPQAKCSLLPDSTNKFYWNTAMLICLNMTASALQMQG